MNWLIYRYENGNKIIVEIKADSFDEAIKKARKIHKDFSGGHIKN